MSAGEGKAVSGINYGNTSYLKSIETEDRENKFTSLSLNESSSMIELAGQDQFKVKSRLNQVHSLQAPQQSKTHK